MKILKLFGICLLLVSCNTPRAVYDYDEEINFSEYSSYSLFPELESGLSELDEKRILASLDNAMQQKGFSTSESPDIYVNVYTDEYQEQNQNNVGIGVGGGGGNVGVGVSGGIPLGGPETRYQITFDFVDVENDALIWQAVVDSEFNLEASPQQRQVQFDKIVQKALEGYPPKQ